MGRSGSSFFAMQIFCSNSSLDKFDSMECFLEFDKLGALIELLGENKDLLWFPFRPYQFFLFSSLLFPSWHGGSSHICGTCIRPTFSTKVMRIPSSYKYCRSFSASVYYFQLDPHCFVKEKSQPVARSVESFEHVEWRHSWTRIALCCGRCFVPTCIPRNLLMSLIQVRLR